MPGTNEQGVSMAARKDPLDPQQLLGPWRQSPSARRWEDLGDQSTVDIDSTSLGGSSGASSGTSNIEQSDRDDRSESHFALISPKSSMVRKVVVSHTSRDGYDNLSGDRLVTCGKEISDAALNLEVSRLYVMQFRANRELFKFIPINEQVEGDKLTKIASNIALAAVEAGAAVADSSARYRGRHNLPRADHSTSGGAGAAQQRGTGTGGRNPKGKADATSVAVERAMGAATAVYGEGYTYEWQKPPIFKAVLDARLAELRDHGISVTDGTAIEWNALVAALDVSVRATAAPRAIATGTPRKRGKGKGPAVSKEKTWFWGWRKTPQSIGARQAQSSTEGKASAEAGRTGSDSGGNSVFSSRSSSQTSGPGSALLGSPASTQYNTPQSTPTSKGSTPAIAEEDETADGTAPVPQAIAANPALQLRVRSWSNRPRRHSNYTPSQLSAPTSPVGDTLSMSLGAADFRLHRQARVQRTPSARQMVLDGWMDDHVTDDPGTAVSRRPRRRLSEVGLSGPMPGTLSDVDERERERERKHDAVVAAALSSAITPTPSRSTSGSMALGRPTTLSAVTPMGHMPLSRTTLAQLRHESLPPPRDTPTHGSPDQSATPTPNQAAVRSTQKERKTVVVPVAKKVYSRSAFRATRGGASPAMLHSPVTVYSTIIAEEHAVRADLRRMRTALAAARSRMAHTVQTARAYARLLLSTRIYHAYCALAHYRERLMLLASEATALAATSARQGVPNFVVEGTRQILLLEITRMDRLACGIDTALRGAGTTCTISMDTGSRAAGVVDTGYGTSRSDTTAPPVSNQQILDTSGRKTAMGANNLVHPVSTTAMPALEGSCATAILDLFLGMVSSQEQPVLATDLLRRGQDAACGNEHMYVDAVAQKCSKTLKHSRELVTAHEEQMKAFLWARTSDATLRDTWTQLTQAVRASITEVEASICTIDAECHRIQIRFPHCNFNEAAKLLSHTAIASTDAPAPSPPLEEHTVGALLASAPAVQEATEEYITAFSRVCWTLDDVYVSRWWDDRLRVLAVEADRQRHAPLAPDTRGDGSADSNLALEYTAATPSNVACDNRSEAAKADVCSDTRVAQLLRAADPKALETVTAAFAAHAQFTRLVETHRSRVIDRWHVLVHDRPDGPLPSDVALGVVGDVVFKRDLGASYVATGDVKRSTTTASPENADAGADVEHPPKPTTGVPRSQHDAWADAAAWAQTPPTSIVAHGAAILAATRQAAWISSGMRMQSELGCESSAKRSLLAGTNLVGSQSEFVNWSKSFIGFTASEADGIGRIAPLPTLVQDIHYLAVDCAGVKNLVDDSTGATLALRAAWQWEADHMLNR